MCMLYIRSNRRQRWLNDRLIIKINSSINQNSEIDEPDPRDRLLMLLQILPKYSLIRLRSPKIHSIITNPHRTVKVTWENEYIIEKKKSEGSEGWFILYWATFRDNQ